MKGQNHLCRSHIHLFALHFCVPHAVQWHLHLCSLVLWNRQVSSPSSKFPEFVGTGKNLFLPSKNVIVLSPLLDLGWRLKFTVCTVDSEWPWVTGDLLCSHISAQGNLLTPWLKKQPQVSNRCVPSGHTDPTESSPQICFLLLYGSLDLMFSECPKATTPRTLRSVCWDSEGQTCGI